MLKGPLHTGALLRWFLAQGIDWDGLPPLQLYTRETDHLRASRLRGTGILLRPPLFVVVKGRAVVQTRWLIGPARGQPLGYRGSFGLSHCNRSPGSIGTPRTSAPCKHGGSLADQGVRSPETMAAIRCGIALGSSKLLVWYSPQGPHIGGTPDTKGGHIGLTGVAVRSSQSG